MPVLVEQFVADWVVRTDPNAHLEAIEDLFESGVTIVNIHSGQGANNAPRLKRRRVC